VSSVKSDVELAIAELGGRAIAMAVIIRTATIAIQDFDFIKTFQFRSGGR
jgi:hypothetical protein